MTETTKGCTKCERPYDPEAFYASVSARRKQRCKACQRADVAARTARSREGRPPVGVDHTAIAEARLFPGRPYASLSAVERAAATELACELAGLRRPAETTEVVA